jgi:hypothetical protein
MPLCDETVRRGSANHGNMDIHDAQKVLLMHMAIIQNFVRD